MNAMSNSLGRGLHLAAYALSAAAILAHLGCGPAKRVARSSGQAAVVQVGTEGRALAERTATLPVGEVIRATIDGANVAMTEAISQQLQR